MLRSDPAGRNDAVMVEELAQVRGVGFRYHRRSPWVLHDVCATIEAGDVVAVAGRNGAGKSTLLRVLAGVVRPNRGSVTGRPAVGYAPERFPTRQPFSVRAYLAAAVRVRALPQTALDAALDRWCAPLGIAGMLDLPLADLSKGTAHKVNLVQALLASLAGGPCLLLLDEPWSGLDDAARRHLPTLVRDLRAEGTSIVLTDHEGRAADLDPSQAWMVSGGEVAVAIRDHTPAQEPDAVVHVRLPAVDAEAFAADARARGFDAQIDAPAGDPR